MWKTLREKLLILILFSRISRQNWKIETEIEEKLEKGRKGIKDGNRGGGGVRTGKWTFERGQAVLFPHISCCKRRHTLSLASDLALSWGFIPGVQSSGLGDWGGRLPGYWRISGIVGVRGLQKGLLGGGWGLGVRGRGGGLNLNKFKFIFL